MIKPYRERGPYKKYLSIDELNNLERQHLDSPIFHINESGQRIVELWLKEMRFEQAFHLAQDILHSEIDLEEFKRSWYNTPPQKTKSARPSAPPNTATFGGYRLRTRAALGRDTRQQPKPKKK